MNKMKKGQYIKRAFSTGLIAAVLALSLTACSTGNGGNAEKKAEEAMEQLADGEVSLTKSSGGNPIVSTDENGNWK